MPIIVGDTDMWYHLNGGRYFWAHGRIPDFSFFSFIQPEKHWINYYWGFQATVFKIFDWDSYQGLIYFRALIHVATTLLLALFLFNHPKLRKNPTLPLIVLVIALLILAGRQIWVRPHITSYLCIAAFLYVLECRKSLAPLLPLLAVAWINLHGKEWVVGALICGAYLLGHLQASWRFGAQTHPISRIYVASILACSAAFLVNPHGLRILQVPFQTDQDIYLFINELQKPSLKSFSALFLSFTGIGYSTLLSLFAGIGIIAVCYLLVHRRLRLTHAIMAAGGLFLLADAQRFAAEWILLTLPLIRRFLIQRNALPDPHHRGLSLLTTAAAAYFAVMPFVTLAPELSKHSGYPFDPEGLPVGITHFLKAADSRGNLLAPPSLAGYSQWALYPDIKIFSDMEFPPFSARDMFLAHSILGSATVLQHLLDDYKIDFIAVPLDYHGFTDTAKHFPALVPVFFDDAQVLYANKDLQPELASRNELKYVDPFNLVKGSGSTEQKIGELERVANIDAEGRRVSHGLTWLLFKAGEYQRSLRYAYQMKRYHPLDPNSHYWVGNDLENLGRCSEAKHHYIDALKTADSAFRSILDEHLGTCSYVTKDFQSAVDYFDQSVNPYVRLVPPEDLYQYAFSASVLGETDKADRMLDLLLLSVPAEDKSLIEKAKSLRARISESDFASLGVASWIRSLFD